MDPELSSAEAVIGHFIEGSCTGIKRIWRNGSRSSAGHPFPKGLSGTPAIRRRVPLPARSRPATGHSDLRVCAPFACIHNIPLSASRLRRQHRGKTPYAHSLFRVRAPSGACPCSLSERRCRQQRATTSLARQSGRSRDLSRTYKSSLRLHCVRRHSSAEKHRE